MTDRDVLTTLLSRASSASANLYGLHDQSRDPQERARLKAKAEGVSLVASYIADAIALVPNDRAADRRGLDGHCPSCSCVHEECGYVVNSFGCEAAHETGGSMSTDGEGTNDGR